MNREVNRGERYEPEEEETHKVPRGDSGTRWEVIGYSRS